MRYIGTFNRSKGLLTESKDIIAYQQIQKEEMQKRNEVDNETESDMHVGIWLLCHPDNEVAIGMYTSMLRQSEETSLEVTHDNIISWLATAVRCHPAQLVPRGEAVTIRDKPTLPSDPRGGDWNSGVGITQTCLLLQYLSNCALDKLSVDERANVLFAILRIFGDSDEIAASSIAQNFVSCIYTSARIELIDALAAVFFQLSNDVATMADAIRILWKITGDEPLVMRLTVEILMCLCQRSEVAVNLPDFKMGDQMYCKQVKMIILDLTSDAHEQVPELHQKDELSNLVNEVFNLKK